MASVRFSRLFADMEAEFEAAQQMELVHEIRERTRIEFAALSFTDRLRSATGHDICLRMRHVDDIIGVVTDVGVDWVLVEEQRRESLVPVDAICAVRGLPRGAISLSTSSVVDRRRVFRLPLRRLARSRQPVMLHLSSDHNVTGTIDRVGGDFLEIAAHSPEEARRTHNVHDVYTVPLKGIVVVKSVF